jgi:hypothetical protein
VTVTPSAHRDLIGTHVEIGEPYPHISATRMPVPMNSRTMDSSRRSAKSLPWHALTSARSSTWKSQSSQINIYRMACGGPDHGVVPGC